LRKRLGTKVAAAAIPTDGTKSCVLQEKHPLGKMEQAFKVEIVRLARKGLRATCLQLA